MPHSMTVWFCFPASRENGENQQNKWSLWKWTYEQTADEETSVQRGEEASFQENLWKFCRDGESLWRLNQGFFLALYSSSAMWRVQTAAARIIRLCLSQLPGEGLSSWEKQDMSLSHPVPGACWGEGSSECGWEVCVCLGALILFSPHSEDGGSTLGMACLELLGHGPPLS